MIRIVEMLKSKYYPPGSGRQVLSSCVKMLSCAGALDVARSIILESKYRFETETYFVFFSALSSMSHKSDVTEESALTHALNVMNAFISDLRQSQKAVDEEIMRAYFHVFFNASPSFQLAEPRDEVLRAHI